MGRVDGGDYFDDILGDNAETGVLEGRGVKDHESLREKVGPDGVQITMNCRFCGRGSGVILEWQELFLIGSNGPGLSVITPNGWKYSQVNMDLYIEVNCPSCNNPGLAPHTNPAEAAEKVKAAIHAGIISGGQVMRWTQMVQQYRGQNG